MTGHAFPWTLLAQLSLMMALSTLGACYARFLHGLVYPPPENPLKLSEFNNDKSGFTLLMFMVHLLVSASMKSYGITGVLVTNGLLVIAWPLLVGCIWLVVAACKFVGSILDKLSDRLRRR